MFLFNPKPPRKPLFTFEIVYLSGKKETIDCTDIITCDGVIFCVDYFGDKLVLPAVNVRHIERLHPTKEKKNKYV